MFRILNILTILLLTTLCLNAEDAAYINKVLDKVDQKEKYSEEYKIIAVAAKRNNCNNDMRTILFAIRKAENGRAGLEFGVIHPKAKNTNLDTQAGWAAATIVKTFERWVKAGRVKESAREFIKYLGARYAPIKGDGSGLNQHWVKNVTYWYSHYKNYPRAMELINK